MTKTCKIKPSESTCRYCNETAMSCNALPDCKNCLRQTIRFELLEIVHAWYGSFAILLGGGELKRVPLSRVYDIREEGAENA